MTVLGFLAAIVAFYLLFHVALVTSPWVAMGVLAFFALGKVARA